MRLDRYAGLLFLVLLVAIMIPFRYAIAPYIVGHWGLTGTLIGLGGIFAIGYWLDRKP